MKHVELILLTKCRKQAKYTQVGPTGGCKDVIWPECQPILPNVYPGMLRMVSPLLASQLVPMLDDVSELL